MNKNKIITDITVDDREPIEIYENLKFFITTVPRFSIFNLHRRRLPVGDIVYGNLAAERKAVDDAIKSIHDGRIFEQCQNMTANYEYVYLLVAGEPHQFGDPADIKAVYTTMADVELRYNIRSRFCMNEEYLCYYFLMLCFKLYKKVRPTWHVNRIVRRLEDEQLSMLMGIKGIGKKHAQQLLNKFKTLKNIMNATEDQLMGSPNEKGRIGPIKAKHIKEVFEKEAEVKEESDELNRKTNNANY